MNITIYTQSNSRPDKEQWLFTFSVKFLMSTMFGKHPKRCRQSEKGILSLKLGLENFIALNTQHFSHPSSAY